MAPKSKTPQEVEQERSRILDAALKIISETGFHSLTMRAIAQQCGMSATKIYYYFINKDDVYFNLMERGFYQLYREMQAAYDSSSNSRCRFENACRALIRFGMENPDHYEILHSSGTPRRLDYTEGPLVEIAVREKDMALLFFETWELCVCEFAADHGKQYTRHDTIAAFAQIHGATMLYISRNLPEVEVDYPRLCDLIIERLVHLITAD